MNRLKRKPEREGKSQSWGLSCFPLTFSCKWIIENSFFPYGNFSLLRVRLSKVVEAGIWSGLGGFLLGQIPLKSIVFLPPVFIFIFIF